MKQDEMALLARAIGHPLRIRVLEALRGGPALVQDMVRRLRAEPTVLSKHLAVLRDAGLIECEAEWRCRRYRLLNPEWIGDLLAALDRGVHATKGKATEIGGYA
ncbi:MAG: winged helix-turn-helix transcriptional regulator [Deltaproteobacteria bacterium]|nr:winged helix-turn-helix transcriptional regulator [Deltaproteobacteria bacterium]